ncbi:MAG: BatA and WFA domain-containing protein [Bacillota bacterium]|nr:BatA and WFA domain-containing protein [Bacillota bacterium]
MTFYSPSAFSFLLAVPVIIVLYLLKQRYEDFKVSSLYLWEEVLRDIEANAPWQKLKKNILMFLQIAAAVLLTFALARPYLDIGGGKSGSALVIIDTSMSMQANDTTPTRFEAAKREASGYISNLKPGTKVTLINMGSNAVIEENLNSDKSSLLDRISSLKVTNGTANTEEAASLVQSIVKQYPGTAVSLFGDQNLVIPDVNINFYNQSKNGHNYAVTLLSHTVTQNSVTALSRLANFSSADTSLPVSLYVDGRVFDAQNINIPAGQTANIYWSKIPSNAKMLECRIDKNDCLPMDNSAYNALNPAQESKVMLVTEKNIFIEKVISLMNNIKLFKSSTDKSDSYLKGYDLYIYDGFLPEKLPADGNILVFNPPRNNFFTVEGDIKNPSVEKPESSLFNYITDFSFSIAKAKKLEVPEWGKPVLDSTEGTIAFEGNLENKRIAVLGFDLHDTDLVLKPAFPIVMTNLFEWLVPSKMKNTDNIYSDQGIEFNLNPKAVEASVTIPSGKSISLAPPFPVGVFDRTDETGLYTLTQKTGSGSESFYFTVNTPSDMESNLSSQTQAVQKNSSTSAKAGGIMGMGIGLQFIFLCAAVLLLSIEWWVYTHGF